MRPTPFIIICLIITPLLVKAQLSDTALIKKLSVNGFCLCKATLESLKQSYTDVREVDVEEMDLAKGCYGQDSRFIAGRGYASDQRLGIVFQKDLQSDYISKIRLTKQFKGNLPNGTYIDLSKLLLKDLFKLYPALKDKWGSRGCSDYWNFSNDTLSFFVKIDKTKQPQFPVDEAYYADKPIEAVDLVASCYSFKDDKAVVVLEDNNTDPVFFIDSIRVNKRVLQNYDPNEIASVTVYKNADAIKKMESATNGLIYIETKKFAKLKYWKFFKSKSEEYAKIVTSPENDSSIQCILNKRILKDNFEGDLAAIDDKIFKGIQIISKQQLALDYNIIDKEFGVLINSDIPPNLHNGKNKF
ncbi:MAG: hypothetical protein JWR67_2918 [Mucilaginibacter sp.]|nr:hypothetical protein [Mucilaginibacter sp.]